MKNFKWNSKVEIALPRVGSPIVSCQLIALRGPLLSMPNTLCIIYKLLLVYLKLLLYLMLLVVIISSYSYFDFDFIICYYWEKIPFHFIVECKFCYLVVPGGYGLFNVIN